MESNNVVLLINSCDAYSDVWDAFFKLLLIQWPESQKMKIVLNTETKKYKNSYFNIEVMNVLPGKNQSISWGERLRDVLIRIESDFVLFFLEDFFLEKPVPNEIIHSALLQMLKDENIASIQFNVTKDTKKISETKSFWNEDFVLRKKFVHYTLTCSPALFRKDFLLRFTTNKDNPWGWEFFGSVRTWFYKKNFYSMKESATTVFDFDRAHGGAIHRGKWCGCVVRPLINKYELPIDFTGREVVEDWISYNPIKVKHNLFTITKNKTLFVFNLLFGIVLKFSGWKLLLPKELKK